MFDDIWPLYPRRAGGNPRKAAEKAYNARIKQGADPLDIQDGVIRYARFCDATGKTGTEYVKQAATFFGPNEWYMEPWSIPQSKTAPRDGANSVIWG